MARRGRCERRRVPPLFHPASRARRCVESNSANPISFSSQNRTLILVNPSERILKLLKLAKLDAVFKIYNTEEEAISAESGSSSS